MSEKLVPGVEPSRLAALSRPRFDKNNLIFRGVEKESLRISADGQLATTPHPRTLGSALTHPQITTDFSEAQLELITGVHPSPESCLAELMDIHRFVHSNLGSELIWPASMPCLLPPASKIPIGQYGTSNKGLTKTVYRRGLANRYGATMQTISGIHYNFSVSDAVFESLGVRDQEARTAAYFGLIRNFRRYSWLLIYLFGASPAICKSFGTAEATGLQSLDDGSLHLPHATSLRMGPLGYQSDAQRQLHVSYNSLPDYATSIRQALSIHHPPYTNIGIEKNGSYQQLTDTLIQIENEFYGTIRPKQPLQAGERPLTALFSRGVGYIEVRCLDLNPFMPAGLDVSQMRLIDTFLMYCLLADSPDDSPAESVRMHANQVTVVQRGREPSLKLASANGDVLFSDWSLSILDACEDVARWMDAAFESHEHVDVVHKQRELILDPDRTPSAKLLSNMTTKGETFFQSMMEQAVSQRQLFASMPLDPSTSTEFVNRASRSLSDQVAIEAADSVDFPTYLQTYLQLP